MDNQEYMHVDPHVDPPWCKKLWCNLWSPNIEANSWSLIYWQFFFVLVDVGVAVYSLFMDEKLAVSDQWGLVNDAVSVPVVICLIVVLRYRHPPWLDRLSLVLVLMSIIYFFGVVGDVLDLVWVATGPRSSRTGQNVLVIVNDLCLFWLWVNLWFFVPMLKRAWNDDV